MTLLVLDHLSRQFPSAHPGVAGPIVLRDLCLELEAGHSLAIMGPSGSGKSTLLNLIAGLDRPTAGSIRFDGKEVAAMTEKEAAAYRSREIGFIFQQHHLLPQCTVLENVLVPTLASGLDGRERAGRLLAQVALQNHLHAVPASLSGGEGQRTAAVRALINRPRLVLADEPTGMLDHASAEALLTLLVDLSREEGAALILVTHNPEAARRMERTLQLRNGHLQPS